MKTMLSAVVLAAAMCVPHPADARGGVGIGFSFGVPVFALPPPVVYAPPPTVYYAPPPPVVYQPGPPVYAPGPSAYAPNPIARTCREYQSAAVVGNQSVPVHGTVCQQPDGSWRVAQ